LYRNVGTRFVEETAEAGLTSAGTAVDAAIADYDRDGRLDLFVLFWRREAVLFRNLGNGKFADVTPSAGLKGIGGQGFSAAFFDFDNDRLPDLLVTAQAASEDAVRSLLQPDFHFARGTPRLFRNRGDGTFEDITGRAKLDRAYGTMQAQTADFDGDGWMDLLLVNGSLDAQSLEPSIVLRNLEGREFQPWGYLPGFAAPGNFLGGAVADFNRDGRVEVYLTSSLVLAGKPSLPLSPTLQPSLFNPEIAQSEANASAASRPR
jgi:hypothetical protein